MSEQPSPKQLSLQDENTQKQKQSNDKICLLEQEKQNISLQNEIPVDKVQSVPSEVVVSQSTQACEQSQLAESAIKQSQIHPDSEYFVINTYGFGGIRYNNALMVSDDEALIGVGCSVSRWDLKNKIRLQSVQTNMDSILIMIQLNESVIITISHQAQISFIDAFSLLLLHQFKSKGRVISHASVANNYLAITCEESSYESKPKNNQGGDSGDGLIEVYNLQNNISEQTLEMSIVDRFRIGMLSDRQHLIAFHEVVILEDNKQENNESKHNKQLEQQQNKKPKQKKVYYKVKQYDIKSKEILKEITLDHQQQIISSYNNRNNSVGIFIYEDKRILFLDLHTLEVLAFTHILSTHTFIAAAISPNLLQDQEEQEYLVLSPQPNILLQIDLQKLNELPKQITIKDSIGKYNSYEIKALKSDAVDPDNDLFAIYKNSLFAANEEGFYLTSLPNPTKTTIYSAMSVTCCGITSNSDSTMVAVGDFSGNINIYSTQCEGGNEPIYQTCVASSIRSLEWNPNNQSIAIGTMEGQIFKWLFENFSSQPELISYLEGSITTLRYKKITNNDNGNKTLLLASTTEGQFAIFEEEYDHIKTLSLTYAHLPQSSCQTFGSLDMFAEIWSVCWSSKNADTIATCSEDQTVHIYDISNRQPVEIKQLTGHTLAVTSIDWKMMSAEIGEVFVSCSDDQTIRVYNPQDHQFNLVSILTTSFVKEWHTLTYLSLESGGTRLAIGSQNGYFFIYDFKKAIFTFAEKIHAGGIEGVIWGYNKIFTCSSDCCVNIIEV